MFDSIFSTKKNVHVSRRPPLTLRRARTTPAPCSRSTLHIPIIVFCISSYLCGPNQCISNDLINDTLLVTVQRAPAPRGRLILLRQRTNRNDRLRLPVTLSGHPLHSHSKQTRISQIINFIAARSPFLRPIFAISAQNRAIVQIIQCFLMFIFIYNIWLSVCLHVRQAHRKPAAGAGCRARRRAATPRATYE